MLYELLFDTSTSDEFVLVFNVAAKMEALSSIHYIDPLHVF